MALSAGEAQPDWEASIRVQRNRIADDLDDNTRLGPLLPQALASAYRDAALEAVAEAGLAGPTSSPERARGQSSRWWTRVFRPG